MLIWESWSSGQLILDVVLVHIHPLLNRIRFNAKSEESEPNTETDSVSGFEFRCTFVTSKFFVMNLIQDAGKPYILMFLASPHMHF